MKSLGWEFINTYDYGDQGSFTTWQKMANTGKYVTYGVFAGDYLKNKKLLGFYNFTGIGKCMPIIN